ncbi:hypothetical protein BB558_003346 [Smittium angustum]|uniref:Actin interacting protein 3 C-terminal domain-containing protein n=1 Tax=Smittium angustum TaxID=133377 RepID=A0A2U1J698_SMIAN|nr:hypothetical protein BB558_003346 [Smittium angustum]
MRHFKTPNSLEEIIEQDDKDDPLPRMKLVGTGNVTNGKKVKEIELDVKDRRATIIGPSVPPKEQSIYTKETRNTNSLFEVGTRHQQGINKIFLQYGTRIKKSNLKGFRSAVSLISLFSDSFSDQNIDWMKQYQDNEIKRGIVPFLVKDFSSQIFYELEDFKDLQENCIVKWNLDQPDEPSNSHHKKPQSVQLDEIHTEQKTEAQTKDTDNSETIRVLGSEINNLKISILDINEQLVTLPKTLGSLVKESIDQINNNLSTKSVETKQLDQEQLENNIVGILESRIVSSIQKIIQEKSVDSLVSNDHEGASRESANTLVSVTEDEVNSLKGELESTTKALNEEKIKMKKLKGKFLDLGRDNRLMSERIAELEKNGTEENVELMKKSLEDKKRITELENVIEEMKGKLVSSDKESIQRRNLNTEKNNIKESYNKLGAKMEDLEILVNELRKDVVIRKSTPTAGLISRANSDLEGVLTESIDLLEFIKKVMPTWKSIWAKELKDIVNEQQFAKQIESELSDLKNDTNVLLDVLEKLQAVCDLKKENSAGKSVSPTTISAKLYERSLASGIYDGENAIGDLKRHIMDEINSVNIDSDSRLEAIEISEKLRKFELSSRTNDFETELANFVAENKFKSKGGINEIEEKLQTKNADLLKNLNAK